MSPGFLVQPVIVLTFEWRYVLNPEYRAAQTTLFSKVIHNETCRYKTFYLWGFIPPSQIKNSPHPFTSHWCSDHLEWKLFLEIFNICRCRGLIRGPSKKTTQDFLFWCIVWQKNCSLLDNILLRF